MNFHRTHSVVRGESLRDADLRERRVRGYVCCDLRGAEFGAANLERALFVGCLLDGVKLRDAALAGAGFHGCAALQTPANLPGEAAPQFVDCHQVGGQTWSVDAAGIVRAAFSSIDSFDVEARWLDLMALHDTRIGPVLGGLLSHEEPTVRQHSLRNLLTLRGQRFEHDDGVLVEWYAYRLGDEDIRVRTEAKRLFSLGLTSVQVAAAVGRIESPRPEERIAGLETVISLDDADRSGWVPWAQIAPLQQDADPRVRAAFFAVVGRSKREEFAGTVFAGLQDPAAIVRAAAISALPQPGADSAFAELHRLTADPDAQVRVLAYGALSVAGLLTDGEVAQARSDPAKEVRDLAAYISAKPSP